MSLQDLTKKISKSDAGENFFILILDQDNVARREFKRAAMDSEGHTAYNDQQAEVGNLLDIYSVRPGRTAEDLLKDYDGKGYGVLKEDVTEAVIGEIELIRDCFHKTRSDKVYLEEVYRQRVEKASKRASKILRKAYKKMGSIPR